MSFVHLHVHSHYSLLKASSTIESLTAQCVKHKMPALALTDYGNVFGALELYFTCRERGIKPLIGSELYLTKDRFKKDKRVLHKDSETLVLIVQNEEGYHNLCRLSTIGYQEGFYYLPRIDKNILKDLNKGLIALTGGGRGFIFQTYRKYGEEKTLNEILELKKIFGDRLYLELTPALNAPFQLFLKKAGADLNLPLTAAGDVHYTEKKDHIVQDVLTCIGNNEILGDESREKLPSKEFDFKSPEEMNRLFQNEPEALENTLNIAKRCSFEFKLKDKKGRMIYHLPSPRLEDKKSLNTGLKQKALKGLEERTKGFPEEKRKEYEARLKKELAIISSTGFSGYFLIVYEFVHWAKKEKIPVGPGRGSGASSLAAYCLGITDLDPMPHQLLFERFLNPERVSMPDFDIDFCQEHRNKVIRHVQDTYGKEFAAQVITFGRMQAKAAVRDVGRILGMSYVEVDAVAKKIPERLGIKISAALEENPELKELTETDSQVSSLMNLAQRIEGLARHVSVHAAGVIIADQPILNYAPLYKGADGDNVIQFDLKYAKKIGLVKFDFLGLKTLTHIREAFRLIEINKNKTLKPSDISLEDPGIYELMNKGDTLGVFQFEGFGITDLILKAKPRCFDDIIAVNALFRPGPMDMIGPYLQRRKSKTARYLFKELEPILKESHGIIVYQEQVLLISAVIAGYSFAEADVLRRAMGEKIPSEMEKQKTRFLSGAVKKGYDLKKAEKLFNLVSEFAKYGFNKAHATAYCVLAAQTAWLKHYYPVEFFASLLTTEINDSKKITKYIKNAKERGILIRSPHVNHSEYAFFARGDEIYFALGAIKGVGKTAAQNIVKVRQKLPDKKFKSLDHFLESVDAYKVNRKAIDSLTKAGAFDDLGYLRAEILPNFERLILRAEKRKKDQIVGQSDLFSYCKTKEPVFLENSVQWSDSEMLSHEKSVIGFYLSQHPLDHFQLITKFFPTQTIAQVKARGVQNIRLWGMISDLRETVTRKGDTMAFAQLEDKTGGLSLVFFSKIYLDVEKLLKTDEPVFIEGFLRCEEGAFKCIVEKAFSLSFLLSKVRQIEICFPQGPQDLLLEKLKNIMKESEGQTPIVFKLEVSGRPVRLQSKNPSGLRLNFSVLKKMSRLIEEKNIRLL